ncbi:TatD family hydrolase [Robertmurraya massiliosenegalensis]|uniref:TatD family hydrolase n=1 Tax=Robertmurraya TaxID=2837507 RepID=UPI0039A6A1D7
MSNYIDFHVHIDYYQDYTSIYERYNEKKIYTLFVTNFPEVYEKAKLTFENKKYVKIALGYHPEMVEIKPFNKSAFDRHIVEARYLGEVGLDFSKRLLKYRDDQIKVFRYMCQRASEGNKIMSVHSRYAETKVLSILNDFGVKNAVFHWYSGSISVLNDIINSGYYFSLNPSMLKSKKGKEIIKNIPLDRILIETDGPHIKINRRNIVPCNC